MLGHLIAALALVVILAAGMVAARRRFASPAPTATPIATPIPTGGGGSAGASVGLDDSRGADRPQDQA